MRLFDAHNHLQDPRFGGRQEEIVRACREAGIVGMVVHGTGEADWPAVAGLARRHPDLVIPAFGLHPWQVGGRSSGWRERLVGFLDAFPGALVGEIGLDRWMLEEPERWRAHLGPRGASWVPASLEEQQEVFEEQLGLARERGRPAGLHCLRAWGRLQEALGSPGRPGPGVLLHSYGGPAELVPGLARQGAYFSCSGWFLHPRKRRQLEVFRRVPPDRLLAETDAPDQPLPTEWQRPLPSGDPAAAINHPGQLAGVYAGLAAAVGESSAALARRLEDNFGRWTGVGTPPGPLVRPVPPATPGFPS